MILTISKTKSKNKRNEILKTKHFWILMNKWLKTLEVMQKRLMNWMIWQIKFLMQLMNIKDDYLMKLLSEWWVYLKKGSKLKKENLICWKMGMVLIIEFWKRKMKTLNRRQQKLKRFEFKIKRRFLKLRRN